MMNLAHARRLLELSAGAGPDEARQNYRDLVRVWHPDRFEADNRLRTKAGQRLAEITEAYRYFEQHASGSGGSAEPPVIRVQTPVHAVSSPRPAWIGQVAIALVVLAAMALVSMPRRQPRVASVATPVESPASIPVTAPAPVQKQPAIVHAAPATRSFVSRETDAVLAAR